MREFTAHYESKNVEMNLKSTTANGLNFRIINSLMGFWGVRLTVILKENFFHFNGKHYLQNHGTGMGRKTAVLIPLPIFS